CNVQLRALGVEDQVSRPVLAITIHRKVGNLFGCALRLRLTGFVFESDDRVGISHIEIIAEKRHSERSGEPSSKNESLVCSAIAIAISQNADAIALGLGNKQISVWRERHPSRTLKVTFCINLDIETGWNCQLRSLRLLYHARKVCGSFLNLGRRKVCKSNVVMLKCSGRFNRLGLLRMND